jgi:hypothetical protein
MEAAAVPPTDRRAAALDAVRAAREAGDVAAMLEAVLNLPAGQQFGAHPGQIPALVHEAYTAAVEPMARCRLAAAVAPQHRAHRRALPVRTGSGSAGALVARRSG